MTEFLKEFQAEKENILKTLQALRELKFKTIKNRHE